MARKTNAALALTLSAVLAFGAIPAPALAEPLGEAMDAEPVAATKPTQAPASTSDNTPVESQMGEEPVAPQVEHAPDLESELVAAPTVNSDVDSASAQPDTSDLGAQSVASGTWGTCPWEIDGSGKLTVRPGKGSEPASTTLAISPWVDYKDQITSIVFKGDNTGKVELPKNCSFLFSSYEKVTTMDLSGADTSHVQNMSYMLSSCFSLSSLNLSGWDTSSVDSMGNMFRACYGLTSLDLSDWNTSNVEYMGNMFMGCTVLSSLDLSGWDTSKVGSMEGMFSSCNKLTTIKGLSSLDTSNVTDTNCMFYHCSSLTSVGDISGWKTSNVSNMFRMFAACYSLSDLDLSGWDTSSVRSVESMFLGCSALTSLDISGWDTSNVKSTSYMFGGCPRLASLKVGAKYTIKGASMFPDAIGTGKWQSTKDSKWLSKDEIVSSRSGVADTYVCRAGFTDVAAGTWYENVVYRAVGHNLLSGYEDGKFGPNDTMTRGQVAVVLWRMGGQRNARSDAKNFSDVAENDYFYQAVRWASAVGVVNGYQNGKFGPRDNVTREQLAVMLANYYSKVSPEAVTGSVADFASMRDKDQVSGWAVPSVGWCFRNGILSGAGGSINPHGSASRAEAAKMVVAFYEKVGY